MKAICYNKYVNKGGYYNEKIQLCITKKYHSTIPAIKYQKYNIPLIWLPIAPILIICDKITTYNYKKLKWDEQKAKKVLDYFLPYVLHYVKDEDTYYYNYEWQYNGYNMSKRVPLCLKKWTRKFCYEIKKYLIDSYENEEYIKTIEKIYDEIWIKFVKK